MMLPEALKSGEPDEPPSVTPQPFVVAVQVTRQWVPAAPPQVAFTVLVVKVLIFFSLPAGWWMHTPFGLTTLFAFHPLK